jgi:hypothetical protein
LLSLTFEPSQAERVCETFGMSQISDASGNQSPTAGDFVEVAELDRDDMVESRHRGIGALIAPVGSLIAELGS